jgi:hypothetical protein
MKQRRSRAHSWGSKSLSLSFFDRSWPGTCPVLRVYQDVANHFRSANNSDNCFRATKRFIEVRVYGHTSIIAICELEWIRHLLVPWSTNVH